MARKLDKLLSDFKTALLQEYEIRKAAAYSADVERVARATRDAENAIRGKIGDAEKRLAVALSENRAAHAKLRALTPAARPVTYVQFDAAKVKPGDTIEVVGSHAGSMWRAVKFVCVAPLTGLVMSEDPERGVALAHEARFVRVVKQVRELKMFAHVFDLNGSVAGTVSDAEMPAPAVPFGSRHIGNNVPVTITVAD